MDWLNEVNQAAEEVLNTLDAGYNKRVYKDFDK